MIIKMIKELRRFCQWCYLTISSYPFAFNLSQHQGLFQWVRVMILNEETKDISKKINRKKKKKPTETSLVVQWLRIHLSTQGTEVQYLAWEDPRCHGAAKPMHHNYCACTLQQEKTLQWKLHISQWRVAPPAATTESPCAATKIQCSQKSINKFF